jgi:hypothetical protein
MNAVFGRVALHFPGVLVWSIRGDRRLKVFTKSIELLTTIITVSAAATLLRILHFVQARHSKA